MELKDNKIKHAKISIKKTVFFLKIIASDPIPKPSARNGIIIDDLPKSPSVKAENIPVKIIIEYENAHIAKFSFSIFLHIKYIKPIIMVAIAKIEIHDATF